MAYAPSFSWDEEKLNEKKQGGFNISGQQANFASNVPGQDKEKSKTSSGRYANIQNYIQANQDQSGEMGQKLTQETENKLQSASQGIQDLSGQKQNVSAFDAGSVLSKAGQGLSDAEKTQYQNIKQTGGYSGPSDLSNISNYSNIQKNVSEADEMTKALTSEAGQKELLSKTFAKPSYTEGQKKLDQSLLMGNQGVKSNLTDLSSRYSNLLNMFNDESRAVGESINQAKTQALQNQQNLLNQETAAMEQLKSGLEPRLQQARQYTPQLQNEVLEDLQDNILTGENLDRLGLSRGQQVYDLNLANYLDINPNQQTYNNIANDIERAKYKDLVSLIGADPLGISEAGGGYSPYNFNTAKLNTDAAKRREEVMELAKSTNSVARSPFGDALGNLQDIISSGVDVDTYVNQKLQPLGLTDEQMSWYKNQAKANLHNFEQQYMKKIMATLPQTIIDGGGKLIKGVY